MIENAVALIPDPGEPEQWQVPTATPDNPSWTEQALTIAGQHPTLIAAAVVAVASAVVLWLVVGLIGRLRGKTSTTGAASGKLRKGLVYLAASIGSGFTITSMWNVFEHKLHIDNIAVRVVLCAVFEVMMLASAVNSRAFRLKRAADESRRQEATNTAATPDGQAPARREIDVDGIAVWVFAAVGGLVCFFDSTNGVEAVMRGFLPAAVAWMWERAIAADLRSFARTARTKKINLRISTERILVALRLAEPTGRDVSEVDKARYRSAFTVAAFKLHTLRADNAWQWRIGVARRRLRRAGLAIMKRSGVAELMAARHDVATLYGIEDFTAPSAVGHLADWRHRVIDATPASDVTPAVSNAGDVTGGRQVTQSAAANVTLTPGVSNTPALTATDRPSPVTHATVTRAAFPKTTVTGVTATNGAVTGGRVRPLSRDLIDAQFAAWSPEQVEDYAAERARIVLAETSNKTAGMREYFLVCLALGVEPKGSAMAKAVGASGGLGRGKAIEWHGALAVDDAETMLRDAHARITAERAAGGDGRE